MTSVVQQGNSHYGEYVLQFDFNYTHLFETCSRTQFNHQYEALLETALRYHDCEGSKSTSTSEAERITLQPNPLLDLLRDSYSNSKTNCLSVQSHCLTKVWSQIQFFRLLFIVETCLICLEFFRLSLVLSRLNTSHRTLFKKNSPPPILSFQPGL